MKICPDPGNVPEVNGTTSSRTAGRSDMAITCSSCARAHPRLVTACETRRRAALRFLSCVCRACDGTWGFGEAREPDGGTRMWATLPSAGARSYGLLHATAPLPSR
ncbi:hypothetical protein GCM10027073_57800 [Streptomyces chlorus]